MRICMEGDRFDLGRRQTVALPDGKGARVEVVSGELWVTQENDRRDLVFGDRQHFEIERDGLTVLHALKPTVVHVEEAVAPRSPIVAALRAWSRRLMRFIVEYGEHRAAKSRVYRL